MNESKISVRYAKALFLSAGENGLVDTVREDMKYILELTSMDEVRELLGSPVVKSSDMRRAISALTKGRVSELTYNLIMLVVDNGRESSLAGIARSFIEEADRFNGITRASLTTTVELDGVTVDRIKALIEESTGTKVELEQLTDQDITGGFMLRVEDMFIDGTVRSQLRKIRKELTEK